MLDRQNKKNLSTTMRHRVNVQTLTSTADGEGGFVDAWADGADVWASVDPIQARQQFEYKSVGVDATHLIRMRGGIAVTEDQRIRFGERDFEILTIENIQERGAVKVITCKERR